MHEEQKTLNYLAFWMMVSSLVIAMILFFAISPIMFIITFLPFLVAYIIRLSKSPAVVRKTQVLNIILIVAQCLTVFIFEYIVNRYGNIMYQTAYIYSANATNSSGYLIYLEVILYLRLAMTVLILIIYFIEIRGQKKQKGEE